MSLRSGYKGIKKLAAGLKWNRPGILAADDTALAKVFFPRSEQAVLGAKNVLPIEIAKVKANNTSGTWSGNAYAISNITFTFTVDDGGYVTGIDVDTNSQASSAAVTLILAPNFTSLDTTKQYILSGTPSGGADTTYFLNYLNAVDTNIKCFGDEVTFTPYNPTTYPNERVVILVRSGQTVSHKVFKPMIRLATDTDPTYAPYAMTNRELTENKWDKVVKTLTSANDLNDIKDVGFYRIGDSTPTHSPVNNLTDAALEVTYSGIDQGRVQKIYCTGGSVYFRYHKNASDVWENWYSITTTEITS